MNNVQHQPEFPRSQQALAARAFHPTGKWTEFTHAQTQQSIPARFESIVAQQPDRLAVQSAHHGYTYAELNRLANIVAHHLLTSGRTEPQPIPLLFANDAPILVALLGILKAGSFYIPIDPVYPPARMAMILEDLTANLIFTDAHHAGLARTLAGEDVEVWVLDDLLDESNWPLAQENPGIEIGLDAYAYIIYTSGSTGTPKGVIENHRDVLLFSCMTGNELHICPADRLALALSYAFSGTASCIYPTLLNGAAVLPFDPTVQGVDRLKQWLQEQEITLFLSGAGLMRQLAATLHQDEQLPHLRLYRLGGDPLYRADIEQIRQHLAPPAVLNHGYGMSEVKVIASAFIDPHAPPAHTVMPVGYAVEGVEILLLDEEGHPVAPGAVGEIAVRTRMMSPGYWRRPELTRSKFPPDPAGGDRRIFFTGDMGRLRPDGCLIHLGHKDFQINLRGVRVELAEVEGALLELAHVKEAAVALHDFGEGDQRLFAYVVLAETAMESLAGDATPTPGQLRQQLGARLPRHMLPDRFLFLSALPYNANRKIDRLRLPDPGKERPRLDVAYAPPRTPVEEQLARIWADVLRLEEVGIHDPFVEVGGHSLLAVQIISRVVERFRVRLPLGALFDAPTVAEMALLIVQRQSEQASVQEVEQMLTEIEAMAEGCRN